MQCILKFTPTGGVVFPDGSDQHLFSAGFYTLLMCASLCFARDRFYRENGDRMKT